MWAHTRREQYGLVSPSPVTNSLPLSRLVLAGDTKTRLCILVAWTIRIDGTIIMLTPGHSLLIRTDDW
jgi:hypothetical protein